MHIYSKQELLSIFKTQLAKEYNCRPGDFDTPHNLVTLQRNHPERRHYTEGAFFFQMATFGNGAVITSDEAMHGWLREYIDQKTGHWLFEHPHLMAIEKKLEEFGKKLFQSHHMFIPPGGPGEAFIPHGGTTLKWFEGQEIHQFYGDKRFRNALCDRYRSERPDILALAAYDGEEISAMAGCSADTPDLWQIGIDVIETYRGQGLGAFLVGLMTREILTRGKIPFYGTSLSNIPSWRIALSCGYLPAWVEIATIEEKKEA
ncbi:MAG: GNAT family N-acetyltransferase [Treponema sp.]|nr:GNAT family N-acetyltransferase [Treponema sp.]